MLGVFFVVLFLLNVKASSSNDVDTFVSFDGLSIRIEMLKFKLFNMGFFFILLNKLVRRLMYVLCLICWGRNIDEMVIVRVFIYLLTYILISCFIVCCVFK